LNPNLRDVIRFNTRTLEVRESVGSERASVLGMPTIVLLMY